MRILLVGAGGVGGAFARIAARRDFFEAMVVADYDQARAEAAVAAVGDDRFVAAQVDATDETRVAGLLAEHHCDVLMNATDPRFVMPLFRAALAGGANYLDMAMSLSKPHPDAPYEKCGVKLGDEQFAMAEDWESAGRLALCRHRRGAGSVGRLRPLRGRRAVLPHHRTRRTGRRQHRGGGLRVRARPSRSGRRSRSASTRR